MALNPELAEEHPLPYTLSHPPTCGKKTGKNEQMAGATNKSAAEMRKQFKAIPEEQREANQAFSVRVWRGLSWLERAEGLQDIEGKFISLWIAFNAIYGHLQDDGMNASDRGSWQQFLAGIVKADTEDQLGQIMWADQRNILRLVDNKYLFRPFWLGQADADDKLARSRRQVMVHLQQRNAVGVFQELFERLYVLRQQVFHGAATCGSKLNRPYLKSATALLERIIPAMIDIILEAGPGVDWGAICFPPVNC